MQYPASAQTSFKHIHSLLTEANNSDDTHIRALVSELNQVVQKKRQHASNETIAFPFVPRSHVPVETQRPAAAEHASKRYRNQVDPVQKGDSRHDAYGKELFRNYFDCTVKVLIYKLNINARYGEHLRKINSLRKENLLDKKTSDDFCYALICIYKEMLQELIEIFNDNDAKNTHDIREKTIYVMRCVGRLNLTQLSDKYLRDKFIAFCDQLETTQKLHMILSNDLTRLAACLISVVDDFQSFMTRIDDLLARIAAENKLNSKFKNILCRDWFIKGNCARGTTCKFAHSESDLAHYKR